MIAKFVVIALLASAPPLAPAQAVAQVAGRPAARALWPHMHQCSVVPPGIHHTMKGEGASASSGRSSMAGEYLRIDLHVTGLPAGSGGPMITAHAINTKGTGTSGRSSGGGISDRTRIAVDCVTSLLSGDAAAQRATLSSFAYMRADGGGLGWSCSVSGSEDKPVFRIGLLVPAILGQAERRGGKESDASAGKGAKGERSAFSDGGQVSIVRHGAEHNSWHVACKSKEPRNTGYDLAVIKKP
jgi:hypothetical protein